MALGMSRMTTRGKLALGTVATMLVTLVFVTVGDGVSTDSGGLVGLVVNHAHTLVWALLTVSLGIAAVHGRWQRLSSALAIVAAVLYVVFLATLLFLDG